MEDSKLLFPPPLFRVRTHGPPTCVCLTAGMVQLLVVALSSRRVGGEMTKPFKLERARFLANVSRTSSTANEGSEGSVWTKMCAPPVCPTTWAWREARACSSTPRRQRPETMMAARVPVGRWPLSSHDCVSDNCTSSSESSPRIGRPSTQKATMQHRAALFSTSGFVLAPQHRTCWPRGALRSGRPCAAKWRRSML